jgi:hypothetical protein
MLGVIMQQQNLIASVEHGAVFANKHQYFYLPVGWGEGRRSHNPHRDFELSTNSHADAFKRIIVALDVT